MGVPDPARYVHSSGRACRHTDLPVHGHQLRRGGPLPGQCGPVLCVPPSGPHDRPVHGLQVRVGGHVRAQLRARGLDGRAGHTERGAGPRQLARRHDPRDAGLAGLCPPCVHAAGRPRVQPRPPDQRVRPQHDRHGGPHGDHVRAHGRQQRAVLLDAAVVADGGQAERVPVPRDGKLWRRGGGTLPQHGPRLDGRRHYGFNGLCLRRYEHRARDSVRGGHVWRGSGALLFEGG